MRSCHCDACRCGHLLDTAAQCVAHHFTGRARLRHNSGALVAVCVYEEVGFIKQSLKVLVACEESQEVCKAFRELGHEAYSCDIQEESGGHPEWHILGDVIPYINGDCTFTTRGGQSIRIDGEWDLLIAHPPCTYLSVSGNRWFNEEKYGEKAIQRKRQRVAAADFFMKFIDAKCQHIAVENPICVMSTFYRKPDQIIQPYQFGDKARKTTCLWLKGLRVLHPTNIVQPEIIKHKNGKTDPTWHYHTLSLPQQQRSKIRSKTFPGIAKAFAEQWSDYILKQNAGE